MKQRWDYGIFVGVRRRSGEFWVVDKEGKVHSVRSVRRIPLHERWSGDTRRWVKGVPWNKYKGDEYEDGEMPEGVGAKEAETDARHGGEAQRCDFQPMVIKVREPKLREFQIRKEDAEKHGYTRGCGGCSSWFRGLARQAHTPACRERFRELMKDDAREKLAEQKKAEYDQRWEDKIWRKIARAEERHI